MNRPFAIFVVCICAATICSWLIDWTGQRYEVDRGNQRLVPVALKTGRDLIRQWMVINGATSDQLKTFDDDTYITKFKINELPPA
jgi:hypothetical protein